MALTSAAAKGDAGDGGQAPQDRLTIIVLTTMKDRPMFTTLAPGIGEIEIAERPGSLSCTMQRDSGAVLYVVITGGAELDGAELVSMLEQAQPCGSYAPAHAAEAIATEAR